MLINLKGKELEFRYGWGAMYLFETTIPNQAFNPKHPSHLHLMYYCMLLNANKGLNLSQEEFIEALDTEKGLTKRLDEIFQAELKKWSEVQGYTTEEDKKKAESE